MRPVLFAVLAIACAAPCHAVPPPPSQPPPRPEIQAVANALAQEMPVREALSAGNYLSSEGWITAQVSDRLLETVERRQRMGCKRRHVREYLRFHVASRLTSVLPSVERILREQLGSRMAYSMAHADLIAGRTFLETESGRALMLQTWGAELPFNPLTADLFTSALYGERETLVAAAVHNCRTLGPPVQPPM
jgi:hypothetical protein